MDHDHMLGLSLAQVRLDNLTGAPMRESMTPADIMEAIESQVQERQERIRETMLEIARLHTVHNSIVRVNQLPPELLNIIFFYVLSTSDTNVDLIRMSHVCMHWRAVALDAAGLWTRVALNNPLGIKTFLQRSKSLPIHISFTTSHSPVKAVLKLVASEIMRVRGLNVRVPGTLDLEFVTQRLKLAAPALEELSIEKIQTHRKADRLSPSDPRATIFGGMPALRTLTQRNVPLLFVPKGPSMLTSINLRNKLPRLRTLLEILENSPLLESLSLHGTFNDDMVQNGRQVALPKLTSLYIHTFPPQGISNLLAAVTPAQGATIALHVSLDIMHAFEDIFPIHLAAPPPALAALEGVPRRLELLWDYETLTLHAYRAADDFRDPVLQVCASHLQPYPGRRFLGDWPFDAARVETLVLCGSYSREHDGDGDDGVLDHERWPAVFGGLPELRTLRLMSLGRKSLQRIVDCLTGGPEPPCPKLETLELFDVDLTPKFCGSTLTFALKRRDSGVLKRMELFNAGRTHWTGEIIARLKAMGLVVLVDDDDDDGQ